MQASILNITFDCADAQAQSHFLGCGDRLDRPPAGRRPGARRIRCRAAFTGRAEAVFHHCYRAQARQENRIHLDLIPPGGDQQAELARLTGLGATVAAAQPPGASWIVLADPEGNEFCLEA